ncbi:MAG: hypothetical protein NZM00_01755, partial [Anaerolinea sp.]|nr:hypothetical protein [Anaerolinea sp.]
TYSAERIESVVSQAFTPTAAGVSALDLFLTTEDVRAVLAVIDTTIRTRQSAGEPAPAALRYGRALALDLLGDRIGARAAYYALWEDEPASPWGQAAAAHLELR